MSMKWTLPTLILSLCASGALQANPLDSPGIVYIDGLPCNRACQSYMAASDRALSARHREQRETIVVVPVETEVDIVQRAARPRTARQPMPVPRPPRAGMAASNTKASHTRKAAAPRLAGQPASKEIPAVKAAVTPEKTVEETVAAIQKAEPKVSSDDRPQPEKTAAIAAPQPAEGPTVQGTYVQGTYVRGQARGRPAAGRDARNRRCACRCGVQYGQGDRKDRVRIA